MSIKEQIDSFREEQDGWLDGEGIAPKSEGLDWLYDWLIEYVPEGITNTQLFLTLEGGVQAEWVIGDFDISLCIDIENHTAFWYLLGMSIDMNENRELRLFNVEDSEWVKERLRSICTIGGIDVD